MRKVYYALACYIFFISKSSFATFSIVAVDPKTREVGAAIATCIYNYDLSRAAKLIPNKGAVSTQAVFSLANNTTAISQLKKNISASQLIEWLKNNDANSRPDVRQNLAATLDSQGGANSSAYTGESTSDYQGHIIGNTYAIAGNIISGHALLSAMERAFIATKGDLGHKLMAAMQAANQNGADIRCANTSSGSAYLGVAKPSDNILKPSMHLVARPTDRTVDPIDELQSLFDSFQEEQFLLDHDSDGDGIPDNIERQRLVEYPVTVGDFSYATGSNIFTNGGGFHYTNSHDLNVSNLTLTLVKGPDMYKLSSGKHIGFSFTDETGSKIIVKDSVIGQSAFAQPGPNETGVLTAVGFDQNARQVALLLYLDGTIRGRSFYALDTNVPAAYGQDVELPGTPYDSNEHVDSDGDLQADYLDLDSDNDGISDRLEYPGLVEYPVTVGDFSYATGSNIFTNGGGFHYTNSHDLNVSNLVLTLPAGLGMYKLTSGKHIGFSFTDETGSKIIVKNSVIGQSAFAQPGPNETGVLTAVGFDQNARQVALLLYLDGTIRGRSFYALDTNVPAAYGQDVELPGTAYDPNTYADSDGDGQADYLDLDSDNDGIMDEEEYLGENMALQGIANQSSTGYGGVPERAIDSNSDGNWRAYSTTHTNYESQPWWQVDLGADTAIEMIRWYNRTDCCSDRLKDLNVFVSDTPFGSKTLAELKADPDVNHQFFAGVQPNIGQWTQAQQGRYVRLQLEGTGYLSLAEVRVHGVKDSTPPLEPTEPNVATDGTANQSSTGYGGVPKRAIDGNTDGDYRVGSTTHTNYESQPWWQVDLGADTAIEMIRWYNRTDCCSDRLKNLNVFVSDTPFGTKTLAELKADPDVNHQFFAGV